MIHKRTVKKFSCTHKILKIINVKSSTILWITFLLIIITTVAAQSNSADIDNEDIKYLTEKNTGKIL